MNRENRISGTPCMHFAPHDTTPRTQVDVSGSTKADALAQHRWACAFCPPSKEVHAVHQVTRPQHNPSTSLWGGGREQHSNTSNLLKGWVGGKSQQTKAHDPSYSAPALE